MENDDLDIAANRSGRKWSRKELAARLIWDLVQPFFRYSPRLCWGWRNRMLQAFGATIGKHVQIHPSARVFIPWNLTIGDWSSVGFDALLYNLGHLRIGQRVTISQRAHLCGGSHDTRTVTMDLIKASVTIEDNAWICADAFIGPNVVVGHGAIVGARACVVRDVERENVVVGNPGRVVGKRNVRSS